MRDFQSTLFKILGERIKERREEIGINQAQLSAKVQLGRTSISNLEHGRQQTPLNILYEICATLDIDLHSILPTYTEVKDRLQSPESENERYLNDQNPGEAIVNRIKSLLKSPKHD